MKLRALLISIFSLGMALGGGQRLAAQDAPQSKEKSTAFGDGEKLVFVISYRAALVPNTEVAEVVFKTSNSTVGRTPAYHVHATAKVYPFFKWFYDLNDTYESWISKETLRPLKFSSRLRENKYRFNSDFVYNWSKMEVNTEYRNLKRENSTKKTMPLTKKSFDAIALFYNLRSDDISTYTAGQNRTLELVLEDTIRKINYKYLGKEKNKTIKGLGKFNTLKFSCQLATSTGESFEDGTEFFLWISDDENKIPLYIESPIKVGSIRGRLDKYENLKHKLSSKVK